MMTVTVRWFVLAAGLLATSRVVAAEPTTLPVPAVTIYPGDVIRDGMIVDRDFGQNYQPSRYGVVLDRTIVVGKVARRTLLPGAPIPSGATMEPKVVTAGAKIRIVFQESGLSISTYGSALQPGAVGDIVSVRNLDSGLTISGVVQADGSIKVNGG